LVVVVRWHGHACFEIVSSQGKSLVIDPHDGRSIGLKRPDAKADVVLITHPHFDHDADRVVAKPGAKVLREFVGQTMVNDVVIEGFRAYHDKERGRRRGTTSIYRLVVDGIRFVHVGDLGEVPGADLVEKLREPDVLFVPTGGTFTIDPGEAFELAKLLEPKIVVPMHYWVPGLNLPLATLDEFLAVAKWPTRRLETNELELERATLPERPTIVVFKL